MSHRPQRRWFAPWRRVCACGRGWPCPEMTAEPQATTAPIADPATELWPLDQPIGPLVEDKPTNLVYRSHQQNLPDWTHKASRGFHVNPTDPRGDTPAHGTNMGAFSR